MFTHQYWIAFHSECYTNCQSKHRVLRPLHRGLEKHGLSSGSWYYMKYRSGHSMVWRLLRSQPPNGTRGAIEQFNERTLAMLASPNGSMVQKSAHAKHARTPQRSAPLRRVRASPAQRAGARVGATQLGGSAHLTPISADAARCFAPLCGFPGHTAH